MWTRFLLPVVVWNGTWMVLSISSVHQIRTCEEGEFGWWMPAIMFLVAIVPPVIAFTSGWFAAKEIMGGENAG